MLYSEKILQLRAQTGDTQKWQHNDWVGDGVSKVFLMASLTYPVMEGTYTVKVGGVTKTETTDYTLDTLTGTLTFVTAPGSNVAVIIDNKATSLRDTEWLNIINDVIRDLGDDFFKDFTDTTSFTSTVAMLSLDLTGSQPKCIAVFDFSARPDGSSADWIPVENIANWRYSRDENKIYIGTVNAFPTAGVALKIKGLKGYTLGTATSDTIDVQDRFMTLLEFGSIARFYRYKIQENIETLGKITQESDRTRIQEIIMIIDRYERWYSEAKARLKPMKPARIIPAFGNTGGRP